MLDSVELWIGDRRFTGFTDYTIDKDIFATASSFDIGLSTPTTGINKGDVCLIRVNGCNEMIGVVDKFKRSGKKSGGNVRRIGGRDLMGQVIDRYITEFSTLEGYSVKGVVQKFLKQVPFVNQCAVRFGPRAAAIAIAEGKCTPKPGQTVWSIIHDLAVSYGFVFYHRPDMEKVIVMSGGSHSRGTVIFDYPNIRQDKSFDLYHDAGGCNVLEWDDDEDYEKRFTKVRLYGQIPGDTDDVDLKQVSEVTDQSLPFERVFVGTTDISCRSLAQQTRLLLMQQRFASRKTSYTVAGHSQNGKNWAVDTVANVSDTELGINDFRYIHKLAFKLASKKEGPLTTVGICELGAVQ